ncbi:hypothetical protein FRB95_001253 [Tulasnella sp. JGI-2019a]|nr:hypothetical protein FRB95_001253 [Tulasnella sp. JGI-2019a]
MDILAQDASARSNVSKGTRRKANGFRLTSSFTNRPKNHIEWGISTEDAGPSSTAFARPFLCGGSDNSSALSAARRHDSPPPVGHTLATLPLGVRDTGEVRCICDQNQTELEGEEIVFCDGCGRW